MNSYKVKVSCGLPVKYRILWIDALSEDDLKEKIVEILSEMGKAYSYREHEVLYKYPSLWTDIVVEAGKSSYTRLRVMNRYGEHAKRFYCYYPPTAQNLHEAKNYIDSCNREDPEGEWHLALETVDLTEFKFNENN